MSKNTFLQTTVAGLELPADVLQGVPHIDLLGREHLRVMNHCGIIRYDSDQIILRLRCGVLRIGGKDLIMSVMDDEKLTMDGQIDSLCFEENANEN